MSDDIIMQGQNQEKYDHLVKKCYQATETFWFSTNAESCQSNMSGLTFAGMVSSEKESAAQTRR